MAVSLYFFLQVEQARIDRNNLHHTPITIRAELRYTISALSWGADRRMGGQAVRYTFNTPDKCPPVYWAKGGKGGKSQCAKGCPNAHAINRRMAEMTERAAHLHEQYLQAGRFPTPEEFAAQIVEGKHAGAIESDFWSRYAEYLEFLENQQVSKGFISNQVRAHDTFKRFERASKTYLDFPEIGRTLAARFVRWFSMQPRVYNRISQDVEKTALYHIKHLKHFLNHALLEGWTQSVAHKQIKLSFRRKEAFPTTLSSDEVQALANLQPAQIPATGKALRNLLATRDWFVFATQTAVRYSDWNAEGFQIVRTPSGGQNLQFIQAKTINPLEVPLSAIALAILQRNGGTMPQKFYPATTQQHLDALCEAAGITKRITTHTARRTFCTLQEKAGVPRQVIMRISGHLTEREYLKYLGVSFEYNAEMLRKSNPEMFAAKAAG